MKKMLIDTNPYLKDPAQRKALLMRSVNTSCGVEGIDVSKLKEIKIEIPSRGPKRIYRAR
jgi:hypothetical protein